MSKIALKVTRVILAVSDSLSEWAEGLRASALYKELKAIRDRAEKRLDAARADFILESGIQEELNILEGVEDESDDSSESGD